jgi:phage terminase large subunit-like protein
LIRRLYIEKVRNTVLTKASYLDNPHLPQEIKDLLEESYGGTQLGRQELYGELIDQDENALWTHTAIDGARVSPDDLPKLSRITVGVDPSGGAGEQGIVVAGKALLPGPNGKQVTHGFVLADRTCHLPPDGWGRRAVMAAVDLQADDIVVERNYGDALAVATIRSAAESMGVPVPIRTTWATRGKRVRAEPVSALTSQGRWHHAGAFPELEDQLCTWTPELDWSPDRLDAMVWTAWHNRVVQLSGGSGTVGAGASRQVIG